MYCQPSRRPALEAGGRRGRACHPDQDKGNGTARSGRRTCNADNQIGSNPIFSKNIFRFEYKKMYQKEPIIVFRIKNYLNELNVGTKNIKSKKLSLKRPRSTIYKPR